MIVTLEISTWFGTPGMIAEHYYGVLRCPGQKPARLRRVIDAVEAKRLNRYDAIPEYESSAMKAGEETERFRSEEDLRLHAEGTYRELYPGATKLEVVQLP